MNMINYFNPDVDVVMRTAAFVCRAYFCLLHLLKLVIESHWEQYTEIVTAYVQSLGIGGRLEGLMIQTDADVFIRMAVFVFSALLYKYKALTGDKGFFLNVAMHVSYINAIRLQLPWRFKLWCGVIFILIVNHEADIAHCLARNCKMTLIKTVPNHRCVV